MTMTMTMMTMTTFPQRRGALQWLRQDGHPDGRAQRRAGSVCSGPFAFWGSSCPTSAPGATFVFRVPAQAPRPANQLNFTLVMQFAAISSAS